MIRKLKTYVKYLEKDFEIMLFPRNFDYGLFIEGELFLVFQGKDADKFLGNFLRGLGFKVRKTERVYFDERIHTVSYKEKPESDIKFEHFIGNRRGDSLLLLDKIEKHFQNLGGVHEWYFRDSDSKERKW